jgi:hypothetical protein
MANKKETSKQAPVSRQTLWQRRHREMGLCVVCSEPAFKGWRCVKHSEQHKINMRFRYIPRVRGRYNVGGTATAATPAAPAAKQALERPRIAARPTAASRRSTASPKRYAKA